MSIFTIVLMAIGLAMDCFAVSVCKGLTSPHGYVPRYVKPILMAMLFGLFHASMPLIGYFAGSFFASFFERFAPWIALALLGYIGGKMLYEGIQEYKCKSGGGTECPIPKKLGLSALMVQGVATSIDALSVGFTISDYTLAEAAVCALLIACVTFGICFAGIKLGKRFGTALSGTSSIFGGSILIFIGLEIFITSFI
jgi:putative Mn2+ efflux pump MntP